VVPGAMDFPDPGRNELKCRLGKMPNNASWKSLC